MVIKITTKTEFIPTWNENDKSDNPIVIEHLTPTLALYNELIKAPVFTVKVDPKTGENVPETEISFDYTKFVKKMVTKVKNLTIEIDDKPMKVESASDLFGPAMPAVISELVREIGTYLQGILANQEIDSKN